MIDAAIRLTYQFCLVRSCNGVYATLDRVLAGPIVIDTWVVKTFTDFVPSKSGGTNKLMPRTSGIMIPGRSSDQKLRFAALPPALYLVVTVSSDVLADEPESPGSSCTAAIYRVFNLAVSQDGEIQKDPRRQWSQRRYVLGNGYGRLHLTRFEEKAKVGGSDRQDMLNEGRRPTCCTMLV